MGMKGFCKSLFFVGKGCKFLTVVQRFVITLWSTAQPFREIGSRRIFSRQDTRAAWRAHVASRVGIGKQHAFFCELIDGWSLVKLTSIASDVALTEIIDKEEYHVGPIRGTQLYAN